MKIGWRIRFCVAVQRWPDASFLILYSSLLLFNAIAREIFCSRAKNISPSIFFYAQFKNIWSCCRDDFMFVLTEEEWLRLRS